MQTVLVASSKGGCGKTTLTTNLAAHYAQAGKAAVVVDADRQASSFRWCARRPDNVPGVLALDGTRRGALERVPGDAERVLIDSPAGSTPDDLEPWLERADAVVVPILPSPIDLEASAPFLQALAAVGRIKRGKLPVALVANRLKPWTRASQEALDLLAGFPFPVVAELRDSQAYVVLSGLGKGIFDYGSEQARSHQDDWSKLLRWLKRLG
ncbi:ATPase [Mizugakiibacter sediminis]|uniref:ATPase n=1 Tax=Mizugakiibacter sediminis TaxID=1475481 RepID=A0A0K8QKC1_9GAMM|nr:ParA family protein [Mizugakiibacter sediminis]GAP65298.1 ATPase [Mizugakiibacter sediminis]